MHIKASNPSDANSRSKSFKDFNFSSNLTGCVIVFMANQMQPMHPADDAQKHLLQIAGL